MLIGRVPAKSCSIVRTSVRLLTIGAFRFKQRTYFWNALFSTVRKDILASTKKRARATVTRRTASGFITLCRCSTALSLNVDCVKSRHACLRWILFLVSRCLGSVPIAVVVANVDMLRSFLETHSLQTILSFSNDNWFQTHEVVFLRLGLRPVIERDASMLDTVGPSVLLGLPKIFTSFVALGH